MEVGIWDQGMQFVLTAVFGLSMGLVYDILWSLRQEIPWLAHLLDLLTGLLLLLCNVILLLHVGDGEYRLFFPVGLTVGFVLWRVTGGRYRRAFNKLIWRPIFFLPRKILVFLKKFIKKMKKILKNPFSNKEKSVKI